MLQLVLMLHYTSFFWQCRRACGSRWGLKPFTFHWFLQSRYQTDNQFCSTSVRHRLDKFQCLKSVGISGTMISTPTDALEVLVNLPPSYIYCIVYEARAGADQKSSKLFLEAPDQSKSLLAFKMSRRDLRLGTEVLTRSYRYRTLGSFLLSPGKFETVPLDSLLKLIRATHIFT